MKLFFKILFFATMTFFCQTINSQEQNKKILDELNTDVAGKGIVRIYEDATIKDVLGRSMAAPRTIYTTDDGGEYVKMRGFKIQAFADNNQRSSKSEAYKKYKLIKEEFPQYDPVVTFDSPFWRVRVGNFKNHDEANDILQELRKAFPAFGKEMHIVIDEIKIPVN